MKRERLANVTPVLGAIDDPKLPAGALDLILMVDVYHEFSEPQKMLRRMREALKPGGRLVLLEYRKEDPSIPIRLEHKMIGGRSEDGSRSRGLHALEGRRTRCRASTS